MIGNTDCLLFTSLAANQTRFFVELCDRVSSDVHCVILTFHEVDLALPKRENTRVINVHSVSQKNLDIDLVQKYSIDLSPLTLSHEREAYQAYSYKKIEQKAIQLLRPINSVMTSLCEKYSKVTVVQESGGFMAIHLVYQLSQYLGLNHLFLEPSFFKNRIFYSLNSLQAPKISTDDFFKNRSLDGLDEYLKELNNSRALVIPKKDALHYRSPMRKILNRHNWKRLIQKSVDKHVKKKKEEFSDIKGHVRRHLKMLGNYKKLKSKTVDKIPQGKNIYFPFHVPADMALTLRAPMFLDQCAFADFLARSIPKGYRLLIKEHPAQVGALPWRRLREVLIKNENVVLLDYSINTYKLIENVELVVSINSKTGAETFCFGKKVLALGDSFYFNSPAVFSLMNLKELKGKIEEVLLSSAIDEEVIMGFIQAMWKNSFEGDIYNMSEENLLNFTKTMREIVSHV